MLTQWLTTEAQYQLSTLFLSSPTLFNILVHYNLLYDTIHRSMLLHIKYLQRHGYFHLAVPPVLEECSASWFFTLLSESIKCFIYQLEVKRRSSNSS